MPGQIQSVRHQLQGRARHPWQPGRTTNARSELAARLCEAARSYEGVPFRHLGRSRSGLDCAGLVGACLVDIGVTVTDNTSYRSVSRFETLYQGMEANLEEVESPLDGDVLLFEFAGAHCGIMDADGFWHTVRDRVVMWTPLRGQWLGAHRTTFGLR